MADLIVAWKKTLSGIKEHKFLFGLLVLLQVLLLGIFLYLSITYPAKILTDVSGIIGPLENANYNATSIQAGSPFTTEFPAIIQSYRTLTEHLKELALWLLGIMLLVQPGLWLLTLHLLEEKKSVHQKELAFWDRTSHYLRTWLKYILTLLVFVIVPLLFIAIILKSLSGIVLQTEESIFAVVKWVLILFLVFQYFLLVALGLLNSPTWKRFVWDFLRVAFKKIHWNLLVLLINGMVLGGILFAIGWSMSNENFFLVTLLLSLLFVLALVLSRIFWCASVQELAKETHSNKALGHEHK